MEFIKMQVIQAVIPMVVKIVADMITPEGVTEYRDKLIGLMRELTGKTANEIDDKLIEIVISAVFVSGKYREHAAQILRWVREYVQHSATSWDDMILLPILKVLESCFIERRPASFPEEATA